MIGPFFIGNRLLLTSYLFSDRLNVEKEWLDTRFRRGHAFYPMPAIYNGSTEFFPLSH